LQVVDHEYVKENGGMISELDFADFAIGATTSSGRLSAVRTDWVSQCVMHRRIIPIYPFLDHEEESYLRPFSDEARDCAELIEELMQSPGRDVGGIMHRKVLHLATSTSHSNHSLIATS
jgi:hypothetical protein